MPKPQKSARDRTTPLFPLGQNDAQPAYEEDLREHFPERAVKVGNPALPNGKAHLILEATWIANHESGTVKSLCGQTRDQQNQTAWRLVGIRRAVCQSCLAKAAKFRVVKWQGGIEA